MSISIIEKYNDRVFLVSINNNNYIMRKFYNEKEALREKKILTYLYENNITNIPKFICPSMINLKCPPKRDTNFLSFVKGVSLYDFLIKNYPLPFDTIKNIITQICEIIKKVHDLGIIHRDLKLENLIIDCIDPTINDFNIYIIDWGTSCFENEIPKTREGTTLVYNAPEMFENKPIYNHKNDIWTIGMMLFILCSYSFPFSYKQDPFIIKNYHNYEYSKINKKYDTMIPLIKKILCSPEDRITINEILSELQNHHQ